MREGESDRARAGEGQRERDTESEADSRLWAVSIEHDAGLELINWEIMTWAEVGCSTDWVTQVPQSHHFLLTPLTHTPHQDISGTPSPSALWGHHSPAAPHLGGWTRPPLPSSWLLAKASDQHSSSHVWEHHDAYKGTSPIYCAVFLQPGHKHPPFALENLPYYSFDPFLPSLYSFPCFRNSR